MVSKVKAVLAPNCVKFRIISLMDAVNHPSFEMLTTDEIILVDNPNNDLSIPKNLLGEEIVLFKNVTHDYDVYSYASAKSKEFKRFFVRDTELDLFHKLSTLIEGTPAEPPIDIDGDLLTYDAKDKMFRCGCKEIDLALANRVFYMLGKTLGYQISE